MLVTMINNKSYTCWILEFKTDLVGKRPSYSRVTKLHGRTMKSYELDVACSKLGLQTREKQSYMAEM